MATERADRVQVGVSYDIEVDTSSRSAEACAREIAGWLEGQSTA